MDARITIPILKKKGTVKKKKKNKQGWEADQVPLTAPIMWCDPINSDMIQ